MNEEAAQPQQLGRNFLEAVRNVKGYDREKYMQEGDYIEVPWKDFRQWRATQPNGEEEDQSAFPREGDAKVSVAEILREKGKPTHIIVEAGGIRRSVDGSLFFNYGYDHRDGEILDVVVTKGSLWDDTNVG